MAFLTAVVVPIIAFVQNVVARYVVQHIAILLLGFVTLCVLFVPKASLLFKHTDAKLLELYKKGSTSMHKTSGGTNTTNGTGTNKYLDASSDEE